MTRILIFIFLMNSAVAQQFTESELLAVVKTYHPIAKQAQLDIQIADAQLLSARGDFDPMLQANNARKELSGINYYNQWTTELKLPVWYGFDIYAGQENLSGDRLNPEETKGRLNYVGISAPIVQNLFIDKRRAAVQQAKVFRQLSVVQQQILLNDLFRDAIVAYWEWWENYHVYDLLKSVTANAETRLRMVRTAYNAGERPAIDTLEAFTQWQSLTVKQMEAFTELEKSRLSLSIFLWTNTGEQYELAREITPATWAQPGILSADEAMSLAALHPELVQYQFKIQSLNIEKKLKFQLLLPEVNAKYNFTGYDLSKTIQTPLFNNNYRFGLSVSLPLRLSEGRGAYREAKLKLEKTRLQQSAKQAAILTKIKQYYTQLQQVQMQLNTQGSVVAGMFGLQKGEETRFSNGESSLFLINARELRTIEAQQKLVELRSKNQKALAELKWAAGLYGNPR